MADTTLIEIHRHGAWEAVEKPVLDQCLASIDEQAGQLYRLVA